MKKIVTPKVIIPLSIIVLAITCITLSLLLLHKPNDYKQLLSFTFEQEQNFGITETDRSIYDVITPLFSDANRVSTNNTGLSEINGPIAELNGYLPVNAVITSCDKLAGDSTTLQYELDSCKYYLSYFLDGSMDKNVEFTYDNQTYLYINHNNTDYQLYKINP